MSLIQLEPYELNRILSDVAARAAQLGAQKTLEMAGLAAPFLTVSAAGKVYGRKRVSRWIKEGYVKPVKEYSACVSRIPVTELLNAALSEETAPFYHANFKTK